MPKRKRHQPGKYKPKPEIGPNFTGTKPLTLFQADNGLWGVKDGNGNVEIELLVSAKTFKPYLAFYFPRTADILNV